MFDFVLPILYYMFLVSLFGFIFCFIYFLYYMKEINRRKKQSTIVDKDNNTIFNTPNNTGKTKVKNNYKINAAFTDDEENFLLISSNKITRDSLKKEYEVKLYDN